MTLTLTAALVALTLSHAAATDYDNMSSAQKLAYLWESMIPFGTHDDFMNPLKTIMKVSDPAYLWAMSTTHSDWRGDMQHPHHKATHGYGAVAKAHFEWSDNNYTGMFQKADNCVIRMANAACPGGIAMGPYGPNLAVKCTRDGAESANMQFIWQLDGYAVLPPGKTNSCSYFEAPLSNHNPLRDDINMPLKWNFINKFQKIDPKSMWLGVSQMSTGTQYGKTVSSPHFPIALVLQPATGLNKIKCDFNQPVSQLAQYLDFDNHLPEGKTLYHIYAIHDPSVNPTKDALVPIGKLVLDTEFKMAKWADENLFFRHTFFHDEYMLLSQTDTSRAKAWESYVNDAGQYKKEGANLYWPLLPGATGNATHDASMLHTDMIV
jgi:hypothetical protein